MTTDIERGGMDVSGSHEPSYYEIALTNRQVVVAFVVLLTCVVAAFLSGVWIGRESAARAQQKVALLAGGGPGGSGGNAGAGDKEKPEGQALQEFKFFADPRHRPGAQGKGASGSRPAPDAAADPGSSAGRPGDAGEHRRENARTERPDRPSGGSAAAASSTLAEDLGRRSGTAGNSANQAISPLPPVTPRRTPAAAGHAAAPSGGSAAPAAPAAPAGRSTAAGAGGRPAQPAQRQGGAAAGEGRDETGQAGEGEPVPGTKARDAGASGTAGGGGKAASGASGAGGKSNINWSPAGVAGASELVIQVFSTADKEQADKVRDGLVEAGFTAFLSPIARPGGQTMYRVRIGPFASRAAAEAVAEKVRKERKLDTWITPK